MDRGERRRRTDVIVARRKRDVPHLYGSGWGLGRRNCAGRLRKGTAGGCGKTNCGICRDSDHEHRKSIERKAPAEDVAECA